MKTPEKAYVSIKEASCLAGLGTSTVRKMFDSNDLTGYITPAGQRRISIESVRKFCAPSTETVVATRSDAKDNILYARVSSLKQMDDLSRQVSYLQRPEYSSFRVITDVASGINFKRKGLTAILDSCLQGTIGTIVIAHRDRLCRFGYELIEQLVVRAGGNIVCLDSVSKTTEQELTEDLMAIIHVFSGKRKYSSKNKENQALSYGSAETGP